jgi:hypothetical protein
LAQAFGGESPPGGDCTVNGVTPIKEEHDEQAG